ncbi:MAG: methylmalonyl-CoA mutase subunit beta [Bacteroidia bacterium]|nr:methylmalonyl-CoA mutase subunit beta [Bacteroidia bacterium]
MKQDLIHKTEKENTKLFEMFPPVSHEEWMAKIMNDIKTGDYEKRLISQTYEGLNIKPFYTDEDSNKLQYLENFHIDFPYIRGNKTTNNNWEICQKIIVTKPEESNHEAMDAIKNGATALTFEPYKPNIGFLSKITKLLRNINIEEITVNFNINKQAHKFLEYYLKYISPQKLKEENLSGSIDYDPAGYLVKTGYFYSNRDNLHNELYDLYKITCDRFAFFKLFTVHGEYFHNTGASLVQELGYSLAIANEYLAILTDKGLPVEEASSKIQFRFAVGSDFFMEIAKLRAARLLWAIIVEEYKQDTSTVGSRQSAMQRHGAPCLYRRQSAVGTFIQSVSSSWNKTSYDPYINMLRTTTETISAILGGADSIIVEPFDSTYRLPDNLSKRYAKNIQLILKNEAYLNKVVDPAAGAYYIECLTDSIASHSWDIFQNIEQKGGFINAFIRGIVQHDINEVAQKKNNDIVLRKRILLGTNQYPDFNENILKKIDKDVYNKKVKIKRGEIAEPIKIYRGAQAFEKLRLETELSGKKIKVWMFQTGNLSIRRARAVFASNFFACAGFEIINTGRCRFTKKLY